MLWSQDQFVMKLEISLFGSPSLDYNTSGNVSVTK